MVRKGKKCHFNGYEVTVVPFYVEKLQIYHPFTQLILKKDKICINTKN